MTIRLYTAGAVAAPPPTQPIPNTTRGAVLLDDASPADAPPGAVDVLAAGPLDRVLAHPAAAAARRTDLSDATVLLPALASAHAHLDLTHIGPRPHPEGDSFTDWIAMVVRSRATEPGAVRASVREGIRRSIRGGVRAVGDIAGVARLEPAEELRASPLWGVSFVEFFALSDADLRAARELFERVSDLDDPGATGVALGLSPHAPYTVRPDALAAAVAWADATDGRRVAMHVAESPEERAFLDPAPDAGPRGPFRDFLQRVGFWSPDAAPLYDRRVHPVDFAADLAHRSGAMLVHVNDCPDEQLDRLARGSCAVAYCARASDYFRQHGAFGPHRYRDMLDAGVPVALGTDSIVNLPPDEADRISPLDDARLLRRRDNADADLLLAMCTTAPARALGLAPELFTLAPGPCAGLLAVDASDAPPGGSAAERALASRARPVFLEPAPPAEAAR